MLSKISIRILLNIFCSLIPLILFSQNYLITYDYTFQRDSNNLENSEFSVECKLYYGHELGSHFVSVAREAQDSFVWKSRVMKLIPNSEIVQHILKLPKPHQFYSRVIRKQNKKSVEIYDYISEEYLKYEQEMDLDWKITEEYKTISSYACQKATCSYRGRNYVAWFSKDIPISVGPYKFFGLPGLIVKLDGDNGQHLFTLTGLEKVDDSPNFEIIFANEYKSTTMDAFIRARRTFFSNNSSYDSSAGGQVISRHGGRSAEEVQEWLKAWNNFIEKY